MHDDRVYPFAGSEQVCVIVVGEPEPIAFAIATTIAACLIAVAGGVSELCALYALYKQNALISIPGNDPISVNVSHIILAGTGILILATTIFPFVQLLGRVRCG